MDITLIAVSAIALVLVWKLIRSTVSLVATVAVLVFLWSFISDHTDAERRDRLTQRAAKVCGEAPKSFDMRGAKLRFTCEGEARIRFVK